MSYIAGYAFFLGIPVKMYSVLTPSPPPSRYRLFDSLEIECWHQVREVQGSIPSQGPRHTKHVIKMVQEFPCLALNIKKGKYWLFLKN